jgi:hypothetical protein
MSEDVVLCELCGKHKATRVERIKIGQMYFRIDSAISIQVCGYCARWKPNSIWAKLARKHIDVTLEQKAA